MAGLIAGRGLPNGAGVLGIAPKATILPVQTMHSDFGGSPKNLGRGITWAVAQGAQRLFVLLLVTSEYPRGEEGGGRAAIRADVVVVAGRW